MSGQGRFFAGNRAPSVYRLPFVGACVATWFSTIGRRRGVPERLDDASQGQRFVAMATTAHPKKASRSATLPKLGREANTHTGAIAPGSQPGHLSQLEHSGWFALLAILGFAAFVHTRVYPMVSDVDSFYHMRHSWLYRANGFFDSSFPWAQFSVVRVQAADLWYGFHILTIPLTWLGSLVDAIYVGGFLVTVSSLSLFFLCFRKLGVRWPLFWVFFLALICADVLYRLTMVRPHPLSLGLNLLLFSLLVGKPEKATRVAIFLVAAALAWLHLALIWLPVFVVGLVCLVRLLHRQSPRWADVMAFVPGLTLGVLLRPHPFGALHLAYVQVVKLLLEKQGDLNLSFGIELYPFYWQAFVDMFVPITILLAGAIGYLLWMRRSRQWLRLDLDTRVALWASLLLGLVFYVMSFTVARRSHEVFFGAATIFLALVFHRARQPSRHSFGAQLGVPAALLAVLALPFDISILDEIEARAFHPGKMQAVGEWLHSHAQPGEVVFHTHWDRFAELFFWNPGNYYINGMDPIFEYAYDPGLAWKNRYYELDVATEATCANHPCTTDQITATRPCLKEDFRASYVVIEPDRTPNLSVYLVSTAGFSKVFESPTRVQIFRVD